MMNETFALEEIKNRIRAACEKAKRDFREITLLGASKLVDPEVLRKFYDIGFKRFGENRVQELKAKVALLPSDCEWHFIGGLQTNKVRDAVKFSKLIHSVDRIELVEEIEYRASQLGKTQKILIEVNIGEETSKHGVKPSDVANLVQLANSKPHIEVIGLMTVAPFEENLEKVRPFFRQLRTLRNQIQEKTGFLLPELSMGMTHDFEVAIEEDATIVRIGTALFGERRKNFLIRNS